MNKAWISILERLHMKMKFEKIEGSAYEANLKWNQLLDESMKLFDKFAKLLTEK